MELREIGTFLTAASTVQLLIGALISLYMLKRVDKLHRSLCMYIILMMLVDVVNNIVGEIYLNNQIVLPIYCIIELVFFTYFYKAFLLQSKTFPIIISSLGVLYILLELLNNFVFHVWQVLQYQPYAKVVENFIIIIFALQYLYEKMSIYAESRWTNFRLNIVLLLYFAITLIFFLPYNFLINKSDNFNYYFWIGIIMTILLYYGYILFEIVKNAKQNQRLKAIRK